MSGRSPSSMSTSGSTKSTNGRTGIDALRSSSSSLGGRAELAQHRAHALEQVGRLLVAVVDERGVGRVQRDPRAGGLADAPGEAVVVGVDVGDHHALHVGHLEAGLARARRSAPSNASSVFQPASTRNGPRSVSNTYTNT